MKESTSELRKQIKKCLDKDRYRHTMGVAHTAACLAMRYGEDIEKAFIAGLLHDCAKCIGNEEKYEMCEKYGIELTEAEKNIPSLVHAKLGAYLAEKKYGIEDEDIINSVRTHTTGEPGMSLLQKIIFTADYIEPGRCEAPDLADVRKLAFTDIDMAICRILRDTLDYLKEKGGKVDPKTRETFEFYSGISKK
ncbi:MAG: bis(5'-nucleosyl)-tetraphosphatase (symmetrical) YqeK [Lachnospiraceae bacterium]|nr:bis(5'-nucleosyl)-tetraphosphatase (symmetrical) YqeK [Lachnospiraceae bacterium]